MREIRWAILIVLAISLPVAALAQAEGVLPIFTGSSAGLTLGGWGSGKVAAGTATYLNQPALDVTTNSFFEGGFLKLGTPLALGASATKPANTMLVLRRLRRTGWPGRPGRVPRGRSRRPSP